MRTEEDTNQLEKIAIIGMSGRFPGATSLDQFWQHLCDGVESITTFSDAQLLSAGEDPALLNSSSYVKAGTVLEGVDLFDADFFKFTPREAEVTDPQHRIFLECAWEALENAGIDPTRYEGRIGVFAGAGMHSTYQDAVLSDPRSIRLLDDLQRFIAIEKDFLATRISYRLNLKGPSISIQTACSTSLVAVHLGCQSLLNGDSDIVLAGGVSVKIPQISGYLFQEGSILSPDGHCRAFDAMAKGTITSSGAGIVVLKRLAEALSDGDCIHAVIAGSSINNDGALKVGYTAPSQDGQATVIADAMALAGVSGEEITYVEAHGTGTTLGDPIEVAALTKAFRRTTQKKGFCAIGSIKTNIGHLDAAAGVAGLMKVVLALENRRLPPSLNFKQANPAIDFANSPFYVQQKLSEWQSVNGWRVAGVSSFGIGGTNVHVIVEEAPPEARPDASRTWQLLPISARTLTAMEKATEHLADFLIGHRECNLADVAFTLQEGRKAFAHRRILAVRGVEDAIKLLQGRDPKRVYSGTAFDGNATVAFMFPAQGAQHANMGRNLYEAEPAFREQIDRCAKHLQPRLELDLRKLLFPEDKEVEEASEQMRQTRITQPAVFALDYALARLWMSWGIMPAAMIGHSLGEYVAATLAGVFDLEDALTLVAERGRLMQDLPPGNMLAVHLSESELQPWLREDISLAAVNAPSLSVVSGPVETIERLADAFRAKHVDVQPLRTSHAFHSAMMEPIVATLVNNVSQFPRRPPNIPFISTLTGTWITPAEAVDPGYWGRQTRHGVRFAAGVEELMKTPGRILLEVGPGTTLSTLAKLQLRGKASCTVVNSLRHAQGDRPDHDCMLSALGSLWMAGMEVDWKRLHAGERRRRVPLPTYPFERKRFWIDARRTVSTQFVGARTDEETAASRLPGTSAQVEPAEMSAAKECGPSTPSGVALYPRPELRDDYVVPQSGLEEKLAKVWGEFFGIDQIGAQDDYFALGGNSIMAIRLFAEIERVFHVKLPIATLFEAPTVAQLAQILRREAPISRWSPLVPIQPAGSRPPFFCVHGAGGNVLIYRDLSRYLGADQPFYGLQAKGQDGSCLPLTRVEDMAALYVKEIKRMRPHGPYFLGGYCGGGTIAYEIAQQLQAEGEQVGLLAMFDTSNWCKVPRPSIWDRAYYVVQRLVFHAANFLSLDSEGKSKFYWGKASLLRNRFPVWRGMLLARFDKHSRMAGAESRVLGQIWQANDRACMNYVPKPYSGTITDFRPKKQYRMFARPDVKWDELALGGQEVVVLPVYPAGMLIEPFVEHLATALRKSMDAAICRYEASPTSTLAAIE